MYGIREYKKHKAISQCQCKYITLTRCMNSFSKSKPFLKSRTAVWCVYAQNKLNTFIKYKHIKIYTLAVMARCVEYFINYLVKLLYRYLYTRIFVVEFWRLMG